MAPREFVLNDAMAYPIALGVHGGLLTAVEAPHLADAAGCRVLWFRTWGDRGSIATRCSSIRLKQSLPWVSNTTTLCVVVAPRSLQAALVMRVSLLLSELM
jgi:hypothetical protein